jgi:Wiskott-Aldrich syndrome protein
MALIKQGEANPRYNPADTLFGSVAPCPPRVATIGPSYPIPLSDSSNADKTKDGKEKDKDKDKDKDVKLPQSIPRPVSSIERIASFITQQSSQIPSLALRVLPVGFMLLSLLHLMLSHCSRDSLPSKREQAAYHTLRRFTAARKQ